MNNLRILFADTGADLFVGEQHIASIDTGDLVVQPGELVIERDTLVKAESAIRELLNQAVQADRLVEVWAWLAEHAPDAESFNVEYESEYDDQGGYFDVSRSYIGDSVHLEDVLQTNSYVDHNGNNVTYNTTVEDAWADEWDNFDPEIFPAGEYTRP